MSIEIKPLHNKKDLQEFAHEYGLSDWHEPDNNDISARMLGTHLDNAFGSTTHHFYDEELAYEYGEFNVILEHKDDEGYKWPVAVINLATLLSIATQ